MFHLMELFLKGKSLVAWGGLPAIRPNLPEQETMDKIVG